MMFNSGKYKKKQNGGAMNQSVKKFDDAFIYLNSTRV